MTAIPNRRSPIVASPSDEDMVPVLVPAGWMRAIGAKLDRLLRATEDGDGPRPPKAAPVADEYLTRRQAAKYAGYCDRTIGRMISEGKLAAVGLKRDRIKRSDVDRMMAEVAAQRGSASDSAASETDDVSAIVDRLIND